MAKQGEPKDPGAAQPEAPQPAKFEINADRSILGAVTVGHGSKAEGNVTVHQIHAENVYIVAGGDANAARSVATTEAAPRQVARPGQAIKIFISYAHEDEEYLLELEKHLALLRKEGLIETWHARKVSPGGEWKGAIDAQFEAARIILLLVSADFMHSDYCFDVEVTRAMARHEAKTATVMPVLLRPCDWKTAPFGKLQALPDAAKPVSTWRDRDAALAKVALAMRSVVQGKDTDAPPSVLEEHPADASGDARSGHSIVGSVVIGALAGHDRMLPSEPQYPDEETRLLSMNLEAAQGRRKALHDAGLDTTGINGEILSLRRRIREGGQLRAGDSLSDGRYLLIDRLGQGGFSVVWKAYDRERQTTVAIKVLHPNMSGDRARVERFFRGARTMSELRHESVICILEPNGKDGGFLYFVMEFLSGGDLRQAVLEKRTAPSDVISIVLRVGAALSAAHAKGLIHRDVKPANIILDAQGKSKLTDFDLVSDKNTTGGTRTGAMGTFIYAAPELLDRPQDADLRADVYGLGMTAVFGLYGDDLPVQAFQDSQTFVKKVKANEAIKTVLTRAVDWDPAARFFEMKKFCEALQEATEADEHVGPPRSPTVHHAPVGKTEPGVPVFEVVRQDNTIDESAPPVPGSTSDNKPLVPPFVSPVVVAPRPKNPLRRILLVASFTAGLVLAVLGAAQEVARRLGRDGGAPDSPPPVFIPPVESEPPPTVTPVRTKTTIFTMDGNTITLPGQIVFMGNSDTLSPVSNEVLSIVQDYLDAKPDVSLLRIEGHLDNDGDKVANQVLSEKRALTVARWLVHAGIKCDRLVPVGFGQKKPIAPNDTSDNRARNRRVVFVNAAINKKLVGGKPADGGGKSAGDPCMTLIPLLPVVIPSVFPY